MLRRHVFHGRDHDRDRVVPREPQQFRGHHLLHRDRVVDRDVFFQVATTCEWNFQPCDVQRTAQARKFDESKLEATIYTTVMPPNFNRHETMDVYLLV